MTLYPDRLDDFKRAGYGNSLASDKIVQGDDIAVTVMGGEGSTGSKGYSIT